jgi:hypothetical protein
MMDEWLRKDFTSFFLVRSSMEFCDSVRNRFILAFIVSLHEFVRLICASKMDCSRDEEFDRSRLEIEWGELFDEEVGKNPRK